MSEVIVADTLTRLGLDWEYEKKLFNPVNQRDYRLPDFTIGVMGDICYWEHLGMLNVQSYREGWYRKRFWYQEQLGIPVMGDGPNASADIQSGTFPLVITSRDKEDGGIDVPRLEQLVRKYILLSE